MALKKGTLTVKGISTIYTHWMDVYARRLDNSAIEAGRPYTIAMATEVLNQLITQNKEFLNTTAKALQMQMNILITGIVGKTRDKKSTKKGWRSEEVSLKDIELRIQFAKSIK